MTATTSQSLPAEMERVLGQSSYALVAFDPDSLKVLGANEAAYDLLGESPGSLNDTEVSEVLKPADHQVRSSAWKLLTSGGIESYRVSCLVHTSDGTRLPVHVWVRLVKTGGGALGLAMVEHELTIDPWPISESTIRTALIVTDHDWEITQVSTGVERILGSGHGIQTGSPLMGVLHPDDFVPFMNAVDDVVAHGRRAMLHIRLRAGDGRWREMWAMVVAMCGHHSPRLGLAIAALPDGGLEPSVDLQLPLSLHRGGGTGTRDHGRRDRVEGRIPWVRFSSQQKEILMRLVRGQRVREIAEAMFLSPSTVRNHLTAIYKKFGVHSQTQLLAKLLDTIG